MTTQTRIVVAEDEEAIRDNIVRLLRLEGYEVAAGADGAEALALVHERAPDLILSDVMMPRLDGLGLLQAVREDPLTQAIPFVFLTARAEHGDRRQGMDLGADDYLIKPFNREELLSAVRSRLARVQALATAQLRLQGEARRLLHYDALTNLPNRPLLLERCRAALRQAGRNASRVALIVLGVDGLKRVNHAFGRDGGDRVLCAMAARLDGRVQKAAFAGEFDAVGRLSGDQFAILLEGFSGEEYLEGFAEELRALLAAPIPIAGQEVFLGAGAGVAVGGGEDEAESLLQRAELALDLAKDAGAGATRFFDPTMNQHIARRLRLHNELHKALERRELSLAYQAQVDIRARRIIGFEALMRWTHPELGFVSPVEFIPVAEEGGLIIEMGAWALDEACRQNAAWAAAGLPPVRIAVNLSAHQFASDDIVNTVTDALARHGVPPERLELEITESIAMQGVERTVATLTAFKRLGLALAMDDFGTGYSSLAYLKRFPLDVLKVDQGFVRNITTDAGDANITRAVVAMAHSFGLSVIAEGVETAEHLAFLEQLGCEVAQGYHFSKPLPAAQAGELLARGVG